MSLEVKQRDRYFEALRSACVERQNPRPKADTLGAFTNTIARAWAAHKSSWLGELENVSLGHGVSLLRWRGGSVEYPHDTPPYPFMPPPAFANIAERDDQTASPRLPPLAQTDEETRWMINKSSKMRTAAPPKRA